ncbi:MAG: ComF family protein [Pseudomonadota bacterium]
MQLNAPIKSVSALFRKAVLDPLLPRRCPLSGDEIDDARAVAPPGWGALHFVEAPCCPRCGAPFAAFYGEGVECPSCIADPPRFDAARVALSYNEAARRLVSGLKFGDRTDYAPMLGAWMARAGADLIEPRSILAPIPLHWRRLAARRFNQSALLAALIASATKARLDVNLLKRVRSTPPQTGISDAAARRRNVAGAFAAPAAARAKLQGAHVILIDDVLTTGATLSAAARTLKAAGAARVDALALSRVVKGGIGAI